MVSRTEEEYIFSKHSSLACCSLAMCSSYSLKYLSSNGRVEVSSVSNAGAGFPKIKCRGFHNMDKKTDCGLIFLYIIAASIVVPNV